jgi:hypothetical protein
VITALARKGCKTVPVSVLVRLDVKNQLYSRCDLKGCDDYPARFTPSGIFIVIDVPRKGMVAKMAMNGSQFVEVVTTGINAIVSFGSCK